jgi:hypothetical protein
LPFFIASMYIIRHLYIKKQQEADA